MTNKHFSSESEGEGALAAVEELADTLTAARSEAREAQEAAEKWETKADELEIEVRELTAEVADLTRELAGLRAGYYEITGENT